MGAASASGLNSVNPFGSLFASGDGSVTSAARRAMKKDTAPPPPDLTKSYLNELARMGVQRQLLQSSGRLGAFKGFNARQRPTSPNPSGALGG